LGFFAPSAHAGNESPRLYRIRWFPRFTGRAPQPFASPCKHELVVRPGIR